MKNLTKRNLIVLAIVGVLVIAVIAVVAFNQVGESQLSGTVTYPYFSPASATISVGATATLRVVGNPAAQAPQCTFSTPSTAVALMFTPEYVVVKGVTGGSATITAACNVGTITAQVTVLPPPTPTPDPWASASPLDPATATLHPGDPIGFVVSNAGCDWSSSNPAVLTLSSSEKDRWLNALGMFSAVGPGSAQARANCISNFNGNAFRKAATITVIR